MPNIHPTAIVDRSVELADDVRVGPGAVIEGRVSIGAGTAIDAHTVVRGATQIGANCRIGPAAYVGLDPQHLRFEGGETWLTIGDGTIIREGASVHRSTRPGLENATRVGRNCFLMATSHIGHDCHVGNDVVFANAVLLGGHCVVGDRAFFGGASAVHQFVRIGRIAILSGNEVVTRDVPPFAAVRYNGLKGYNAVGCRRAGISRESIHAIRAAYRCIHTNRTIPAAVESIRAMNSDAPEVRELLDFIANTKRGIQPSARYFGAGYNPGEEGDAADAP